MSRTMKAIGMVLFLASVAVMVYGRPPTIYDDPQLLGELTGKNKASTGQYVQRTIRPRPTAADPNGPIAETQYGPVQGYTDDSVNIWRGIPFAAPPTGDLRFREPQDAQNWTEVRNAYIQGNICPQIHIFDWLYAGNEDCLYLDVYSPVDAAEPNLLPVFVWIYGGAYILGDDYEFGLYDGTNVAQTRNHVIVAMNYRVGPLGFMANDAIRADNPENYGGSWGMLDQVKALNWVQKNIAKFGGDPNRVTIAGESAGAFSVCWHLASPLSAGLFHGAILESGTCDSQPFFTSYADQRNWTNTYIQMVGCDPNAADSLQCIRNLSTGVIMGNILGQGDALNTNLTQVVQNWNKAYEGVIQSGTHWGFKPLLYPLMSWGNTIDGVSLTDVPLNVISSGSYNAVPVIMGFNHDEGTIFTPTLPLIISGTSYPTQPDDIAVAMRYMFQNNATVVELVNSMYPLQDYSDATACFNVILRDYMFTCTTRRALLAMQAAGAPTWMYHWHYHGDWIEDLVLGDYHSSELEFVFDNQWPPIIHLFSQADTTMANTIDTYWANMVNFLNPNGNATASATGTLGDELFWPTYDPSTNETNIALAVPSSLETQYFSAQCDMWDSIDAENRQSIAAKMKATVAAKIKKPKIILSEQ